MLIVPKDIIGVDVFLERFQTRLFVGQLKKTKGHFHFRYDSSYLKMRNILPLGPEFPLTQQDFFSEELSSSFVDRIPDPENPSYKDYCTAAKIPLTIIEPLVLLSTIGKRGPSSFIFEPIYENKFNFQNVEQFMEDVGLSRVDFALLFDVSSSILQKMKAGQTSGQEVLRRLEICLSVPKALDYQIQKNRKWLHPKKLENLDKYLSELQMREQLKENYWKRLSYEEVDYTQDCLSQLQTCPWAELLIKKINQWGFTQESMPLLFEIRFAYHLHSSGLEIQHEHKAGIGATDIDFLVTEKNGTKWLIELTSLNESEEVKKNTMVLENFRLFESTIAPTDIENNQESLALIKTQNAILSKIAKIDKKEGVKPTKFPALKSNEYNIIIIDMRGFPAAISDVNDYMNILYGSKIFKKNEDRETYGRHFIDPETDERNSIIGIFDSSYPDERARYLRERIHGVGFICEKFGEGKNKTELRLFSNPDFFSIEEIRHLFPIKT